MGKLILTSGGYLDGQRGKECDEIIEKSSKAKNVLLVDNATLTGSNVKGLPVLLENFRQIARSVTQITLDENNITQIKNYDVIYVTGGDLTPLINLNSVCDLTKIFKEYMENGGIIIGESAGSIIFGKDTKWYYDVKKGTKPKYDVVLSTYEGIGLTDINFFPHWNKASDEMKEKVALYEKEHGIKIERVSDGEFFEIEFEKSKIKG